MATDIIARALAANGGGGGGEPVDAYTKAETNDLLATKADKNTSYTKTEVNNLLAEKEDNILSFDTWAEYNAVKDTIPADTYFLVKEDEQENPIPSHNSLMNRDANECHPINAITGLQAELDKKTDATDTDVLKARVDQLVGEVPPGSADEIADARVMVDGKTSQNLGDAIRTQVSGLKETIENVDNETYSMIYGKSNVLDYSTLEKYANGYVVASGAIESADSHFVVKIKVRGITKLKFDKITAASGLVLFAIYDSEMKYVPESVVLDDGQASQTVDITNIDNDDYYILLNWFAGNKAEKNFWNSVTVEYKKIVDLDYIESNIKQLSGTVEGIANSSTIKLDHGNDNGYWENASTLKHSTRIKNTVMKVLPNIKTIKYTVKDNLAVETLKFGYVLNEDKSKVLMAFENTLGQHIYTLPDESYWLLLNFFGTEYSDGFEINLYDELEEAKNRELLAESGEMYFDYSKMKTINGYIDASGTIQFSNSNVIAVMPVGGIKKLKFEGLKDVALPSVVIKDKDGNLIGAQSGIVSGTFEYNIPSVATSDSMIYLNWFTYATTQEYLNGVYAYTDNKSSENEIKYSSCVNKPFDFSGKKALFYGDSITVGHTTGTHVTPNGYPKLFCDSVNMTFTNHAIAGSCFSYDYSGNTSIIHAIGSTPMSELNEADYIFIAGGVNDWGTGCSEELLTASINTLCDFITTNNLSDKVIFITPINEGGRPTHAPTKQSLQNVRNIITRRALEANCSVVQGNEIPFPTANDNAQYIDKMYGDKLHPSEFGYRVYARYLKTILL